MLNSLRTVVEDSQPQTEDEGSDPSATENPKFLTDRPQICRLLCQLKSSEALISIVIPGLRKHYATSLLEVDEQNGFILLDELNPKGGDSYWQEAGRCKILSNFQGVEVSFSINGVESVGESEAACFRIALPDRVYYPQRRNSPRLKLWPSHTLSFAGKTADRKLSLQDKVYDISVKGIGLLLAEQPPVVVGDRISECQIVLPENQKIEFDLEVRHMNLIRQQNEWRIGALFEKIAPKDRRALQRFLIDTERAKLKKDL